MDVIIQCVLAVAIFCLILIRWHLSRIYNYWEKRGIPYEKPFLIFGNLQFLMRKSVWDFFYELRKKHSTDYVGIFLGWKPALVVQTSELAKKILQKDVAHFQDRFLYADHSDPLGSLNLFTVKNPIWSDMRHELSPMFTSLRLKTMTELMNINAQQLVKKIKRDYVENNKTVNLKELFSMYTSDTVAYSVFGLRVSVLSDQLSPLWYITNHMVKWTFWRGLEFSMIFLLPAVAKLLRLKFFSAAATEYIKKLFWDVVENRKNTEKTNSKDLVNHLLKLKENFKLPADVNSEFADNLMLAQAGVFILGSIETSSTVLSYCLHELAYHPEEQKKLYNEINDALTRSGKDILQYEDLMELKYLSSCIYETLRKYPTLGYLDRICNEDYKLNDEVTIEKGVPVLVNVLALHYDESVYPEPQEWRPERISASSDSDNLHYTFLPFGEGPRFCIGKRYGMMQIRAALAQLVHKFKVEPGPVPYYVISDPYSVILAPKNGGSVKFIPR
uniref:unspecific monooxygenase n=1 Tax=Depressaria pastinacella TaxID=58004 RepID=A0A2Z6JJT5_DEPPA|nr:TPA_inf: cytochrome P450 CYP332A13 [Depressaria pastinacella]